MRYFISLALISTSSSCSPEVSVSQGTKAEPLALILILGQSAGFGREGYLDCRKELIASCRELNPGVLVGILECAPKSRWILPFGSSRETGPSGLTDPADRPEGSCEVLGALREAHTAMSSDPRMAGIRKKLVVLFADGDADATHVEDQVRQMAGQGEVLTTLCLVTPRFDPVFMSQMATWGAGRFYFSSSSTKVPSLFRSELRRVFASTPKE
ncbi:MAG TPA: hypothetical protein VKU80_17420 [Planctomycetota bacterium]|nr:hypothetical protein [Planctomycetota bacterium]